MLNAKTFCWAYLSYLANQKECSLLIFKSLTWAKYVTEGKHTCKFLIVSPPFPITSPTLGPGIIISTIVCPSGTWFVSTAGRGGPPLFIIAVISSLAFLKQKNNKSKLNCTVNNFQTSENYLSN